MLQKEIEDIEQALEEADITVEEEQKESLDIKNEIDVVEQQRDAEGDFQVGLEKERNNNVHTSE